jgi:SNF2 family DNA or RNA helicase
MLDLSKLKNRTVLLKLKEYEGPNEYIHRLRMNALRGKVILTPSQVAYINDNYTTEPIEINKVVEITSFFGEQLEEKWDLKHTPERILVETLLAESDKAYHVKGKLYRNQKKSELYFLPKTQLNSDLFEDEVVDIDVDFVRYKKMDHYLLSDGTIGRTAFKYQEEGIKFLLSKKKCVLADDMGLGKTYQSIVAALESGAEKILVVCPANAKINWKREICNFIPEDEVSILKTGFWDPKRFTIINYDILKNFHTLVDGRRKYEEGEIRRHLANEGFDLIIMDEAHMVKNPKSQRTKIINEISEKIERRWLLTGTPIANRPMDYFNLLFLCDSPLTAKTNMVN